MFWRRAQEKLENVESDQPRERNILVISDIHLGRDPRPITGFSESHRPTPEFDENFVAMLRHYTEGEEHQWRLVLGGDFLDFVEVVVRPGQDTPLRLTFEVTKEEMALGLGSEPERARVKLDMIVDYHLGLFRALAGFVRRGGALVLMRGNHDAEMFWEKVQRVLRQRLADLAFSGERLEVDDLLEQRAAFQSRIEFGPWCYIEPGRVYFEHGHQYDPYCSFDHQLYPVSPNNPRRIDTPLFMFAMRYFVNRLSDFAAHYADHWTPRDYWRWMRQKGPAGVLYTLGMALEVCWRLVHYSVPFSLGRARRYHEEQERRLSEEATRFGVPEDALRRIDALHHTPVTRNLPELMRLLFLDRILLALGTLALMTTVLVLAESTALELFGVLAALAGAWAVNRRLAPRRFLLPGPRQAHAARAIAEILGVRIVVMGHSHQRRKVDLGEGRYYVNTGCWLPPFDSEPHPAEDTCTCNLSHLVIRDRQADLKVFCRVNRRPRTDLPPVSPLVPRPVPSIVDLPPPLLGVTEAARSGALDS